MTVLFILRKANMRKIVYCILSMVSVVMLFVCALYPSGYALFFSVCLFVGMLLFNKTFVNIEQNWGQEDAGAFGANGIGGIACYITAFTPFVMMWCHGVPLVGISDTNRFVKAIIFWVIAFGIVLIRIVCKHRWIHRKKYKLMVTIALFMLVYFFSSFLAINCFCDNGNKKELVVVSQENFRDGSYYNCVDSSGDNLTIRDYTLIFVYNYKTINIKSGDGSFGIAYENMFISGEE